MEEHSGMSTGTIDRPPRSVYSHSSDSLALYTRIISVATRRLTYDSRAPMRVDLG